MSNQTKTHESKGRLTLDQYWATTKLFRTDLLLSLLIPISNILLFIFAPLLASKILAGLITGDAWVWSYFWASVAVTVTGLALNLIGIRSNLALSAKVMHALFTKLFDHLMQRSVGFYNNQVGGKLISDALDYVQGYGQLMNAGYLGVFTFMTTSVVGLLVIFVNSWQLGLMLTVLLGSLIKWTVIDNKRRKGIRQERLKINKRSVSHLSDSIVNAITVKTFAKESQEKQVNAAISKELMDVRITDWQRTVTYENARISVIFAAQLFLIAGLIILTARNPDILATGIFAFTYTISLLGRFFAVNVMLRQIDEALLIAQPMTELLEADPEIQDVANATILEVKNGEIAFNDVSFGYADSDSDSEIFSGLNLIIKPGEKVGLVGHSGGGKSTLTRLILRFDTIGSGTIAIDGQDIATVTQESLRQQIAYVPQEPLLFHRTISENIAYSDYDASKSAVKAAASKAFADDFINDLPRGYDTIVGERGVKLSGGQRQRIAIARAILKDAPILVLDEATSALDSESEGLIQKALWKLMEGKTAIVIAHRLSTIQKMDRILVLDNGRVIEQGSHKQLIKAGGTYAILWSHQSGGFIED